MNSQNMENKNRIWIRRDLQRENDNFQLGNDGVKNDNNDKVKIMKLENRIKELRLEIDFNKVFDEEMERSLNNRISKLHKEKQLLSKELAVKQRIIENLERRNGEKSTNNSLKEAQRLNVPPKKKIKKNRVQVQKQRGFNFGSYDPPSTQFNFGWCNEPAPNPLFFGRQERQQVVNYSFNRGFPQHSTVNQNHGWCHEHNMDRSHYCKVDNEKVCLKCLVFGSHNGHESLDLQQYSQQVVYNSFNRDFPQHSTFNQNHGWCHEHNMKSSHYCKVDDEKVCLKCLVFGSHNGHESLDLDLEQVQKQRGFNFGSYDPPSTQSNFGWCNEPALNPMFFGRQERQQVVYNRFNLGFPQNSTFNQNHGWCHEHNMVRSYFCKVCDEKVCIRCLMYGSHNGHESLYLEQHSHL